MLTPQSYERRRRGTEYDHASGCCSRFEAADDLCRRLHRLLERAAPHDRVDQRHHRRISHAAAKRELALEERAVVLAAGQLDAVVLGVEGLHDGLAGALAAPGPPGDLRQQLERALGSAKISESQPDVRRDDPDKRDTRKVMALRDHLRADEDVQLAGREAAEE